MRHPVVIALVLFSSATVFAGTPGSLPNIVAIVADDMGWGDLGYNGHPSVQTPALDRLARDGASFSRFYVSPVCAPTRAEFLTGRHHLRGGVTGVSGGNERLSRRERTIAEWFRNAGYATGCFGKWHNGANAPFHPNQRGFDEFYGFTSGHWASYFDAEMDQNGRPATGRGYMPDDLTDHAMAFARRNASEGRPFFLYLAFNTPHSPMQVPVRFWDVWRERQVPQHSFSGQEDPVHTRAALAMVENLDWNIGRFLAALDELGVASDTIVLFFSDNGPNGWRWNDGLKGIKASTDEGGVRSPLLVRWPGRIASGTRIEVPAAAIDLLPSLASLAGVAIEAKLPLDGANLAPILTGDEAEGPDRLIFSHWSGAVSARDSRHMLDARGRLFDLLKDPGQTQPIETFQTEVARRMSTAVAEWRREMEADAPPESDVTMIGIPGTGVVSLLADDASIQGDIARSNRYPNCSYVLGWKDSGDFLSWPVEVLAPGRYSVAVFHTCAESDVGTTLEVRVGDRSASGVVDEAWDPPASGAEHDRVPRQESYMKDFRPLDLGVIELPGGRSVLELRATGIPGSHAIEFRKLVLRDTE